MIIALLGSKLPSTPARHAVERASGKLRPGDVVVTSDLDRGVPQYVRDTVKTSHVVVVVGTPWWLTSGAVHRRCEIICEIAEKIVSVTDGRGEEHRILVEMLENTGRMEIEWVET